MHMKIVPTSEGRFILGQFSNPFSSIPEMIQHYSVNKLPIKGAEHMSLLYPVIDQLLQLSGCANIFSLLYCSGRDHSAEDKNPAQGQVVFLPLFRKGVYDILLQKTPVPVIVNIFVSDCAFIVMYLVSRGLLVGVLMDSCHHHSHLILFLSRIVIIIISNHFPYPSPTYFLFLLLSNEMNRSHF